MKTYRRQPRRPFTHYPTKPTRNGKPAISVSDLPERQRQASNHTYDYLDEREIDAWTISESSSCYFTERGICFLLHGESLGYQERITDPDSTHRFMYPSGIKLGGLLFKPDKVSDSDVLFIVEGTADALAIIQEGFNAVSILGSNLTREKVKSLKTLIADYERTYYIPDNDAPGMHAVYLFIKHGLSVNVRFLPFEFKDICEMPRERRKYFLDHYASTRNVGTGD